MKYKYEVYVKFKDGGARGNMYRLWIIALIDAKKWLKRDTVDNVSIILYKKYERIW